MGGEIEVLKNALKRTKDGRERDRIRSIILIKKGYNIHEVADIMNELLKQKEYWTTREVKETCYKNIEKNGHGIFKERRCNRFFA